MYTYIYIKPISGERSFFYSVLSEMNLSTLGAVLENCTL